MNLPQKFDIPHAAFFLAATFSALVIILIVGFLVSIAAPVLLMEGTGFITGTVWNYETHQYGILYFIVGTIVTTVVTLLIAIPIGVCTAIFLAEWAPPSLRNSMKTAIEMLVGIPSVVYGIFGLFVLSDIFRDHVNPAIDSVFGFIPIFKMTDPLHGGNILLAAVVLSFMIIPLIISISYDAIYSVSHDLREASYAVGATQWDTIKRIIIPSAFTAIVTASILGMMRAMGETMAVIMVAGGSAHIPSSILDNTYLMTSKILNDIPEYMASDEPRSAIFGIALVLFAMEFVFVLLIRVITSRFGDRTS